MIVVSTRIVVVTVLARGIRPVESVVGVQGGQMMVMVVAEQRQVRMSSPWTVCAQSQVPGSWTRRPVIVAAVASIAAARIRQVVVQRGQLMVVLVVQVAVGLNRATPAQDVVDHEARARRLEDRHGAPLDRHRHLCRCGTLVGADANL